MILNNFKKVLYLTSKAEIQDVQEKNRSARLAYPEEHLHLILCI